MMTHRLTSPPAPWPTGGQPSIIRQVTGLKMTAGGVLLLAEPRLGL